MDALRHIDDLQRSQMRRTLALIVALAAAGPLLGATAPVSAATPAVTFTADAGSTVPVQDQLALLLASAAAEHRAVRLPAGTLQVSRTMWLPQGSTLQLDPKAVIEGSVAGQSLIRMQSRSRLTGGTVVNRSTSDCFDVDVAPGTRGARVDGVTFRGVRANAVYLNAADIRDLVIRRSRFIGTNYGVILNPGSLRASGISVRDNTFSRTTGDAVEINGAIAEQQDLVRNVIVSGNTVTDMRGDSEGSGFAIGIAGVQGFRITGNTIVGARSEAVHIEDRSRGGVVDSNQIRAGGSGGRAGIALYRTVASVRITRNAVTGFRGTGIGVLWDSMGSSTNVSIERNVVSNVLGDGIVVGGDLGTGPFEVEHNVIQRAAGNGIAVLGTHARSVVAQNLVRGVRGAVVTTRYAGRGIRTYTDNGVLEGRTAASVLGTSTWRVVQRMR